MIVAVRLAILIVRMNQQDRPPGTAGEGARLGIDGIAELLDGPPDLLPCLGANVRLIVEHTRNGDACNPCRFRNIVDG